MDKITDHVQPVSHPVLLACALRIWAGQAGKATRAKAGLVTHRVFEPAWSRDPLGPRPFLRSGNCSPARPGACSPRTSRGFRDPAVAVLMAAVAVSAGDSRVEAGGTRAGS